MNKYTICPLYVKRCVSRPREFVDVLFKFAQSNQFKVIVDEELEIINRYRDITDNNGLVVSWIECMISDPDNFFKISMDLNGLLNDQDLAVNISSSVIANRKLAVQSSDDYIDQMTVIKSNSITLIEPINLKKDIDNGPVIPFDHNEFLTHIIYVAARLQERRLRTYVEDCRNDDFTLILQGYGYNVCDQSRSGISGSGKSVGELDLAIRSPACNGAIETIVEALRLSACSSQNTTVSTHLDKLLNRYDNAGVARNYFLIYAESENFTTLWSDYFSYLENINSKPDFNNQYGLCSISDISENEIGRAHV